MSIGYRQPVPNEKMPAGNIGGSSSLNYDWDIPSLEETTTEKKHIGEKDTKVKRPEPQDPSPKPDKAVEHKEDLGK
ncbi:hypothetical protein SBOR_10138 [Sclerotinia borealis F-4128]|uniref:Uncharacterized protein n=1 Tax=Sclerotinia borealis (strain F-4128) TaxID=1432307 RepID=W9C1A0_SCLBF|nr:hypothetical protein SBOR_10138 [Sclerotinia borealis F-4128]